jgi:hypothetical protein
MSLEDLQDENVKGATPSLNIGPGGGRIKRKPPSPRKKANALWTVVLGSKETKLKLIGIPIAVIAALLVAWAIFWFGPSDMKPRPDGSSEVHSRADSALKSDAPAESKITTHVATFDLQDNHNKTFKFGNCPGEHCYEIERGGRLAVGKTSGQIFHIFGTGFIQQTETWKDDSILVRDEYGSVLVRDGLWGFRYIFEDGSSEYRWINMAARHMEKGSRKPLKGVQLASWIPLEKHARVDMVSPQKDVVITVLDDSINHLQIKIEVSPGTYCSKEALKDDNICKT